MQTRSRRPRGIHSKKISVSVSAEDLVVLAARAKRVHGGNISAVLHDLVDTLRREQAADEVLEMLGGAPVTPAQMQDVRNELYGAKRRRRRRPAA